MWSRRAQEYSQKINSGDPIMLSEVIRDLYRKNNQPEQSYSERQMFQSAVERLAIELAAVEKEIKDLKKTSLVSISKIASETSAELIKNIINTEVNKSNVAAVVEDIVKKNKEKYI